MRNLTASPRQTAGVVSPLSMLKACQLSPVCSDLRRAPKVSPLTWNRAPCDVREASFAACSLLILGISDASKGWSMESGSLMYDTSFDSSADKE